MSDGPKKNGSPEAETTYITMDPEEFNQACKRLDQMLKSRVARAWQKKSKRPTNRSAKNHIEAAKDAFAFIHLIDLIEHMSEEIFELRQELNILSEEVEDDEPSTSAVWSGPKAKSYIN